MELPVGSDDELGIEANDEHASGLTWRWVREQAEGPFRAFAAMAVFSLLAIVPTQVGRYLAGAGIGGVAWLVPLGLIASGLAFSILAVVAVVVMLAAISVFELVGERLGGQLSRGIRWGVIGTMVLLGMIWLGVSAHEEAALELEPRPEAVSTMRLALDEQRQTASELRASSTALLSELAVLEGDIREQRQALAADLESLERRSAQVDELAVRVDELEAREFAMTEEAQLVSEILDGERPISLRDLERSSRSSLLLGTVFSFVLGILGTLGVERARRSLPWSLGEE